MTSAYLASIPIETHLSDADLERIVAGTAARVLEQMANPAEVLTTAEAAALLRCAETQLRAWVAREGCPVLRVDAKFRFVRSELLAWARARCVVAPS